MNGKYFPLVLILFIVTVSSCISNPVSTGSTDFDLVTDTASLEGLWEPVPPAKVWREYRQDGSFRAAESRDALTDAPSVIGMYWFEGSLLFFKEIAADPGWGCGEELVGQYQVQRLESGEIKFVKFKDECSERVTTLSGAMYKKAETIIVETSTATPTTESIKITVTFEGDQCLWNGPKHLPTGHIQFALDVENQIFLRRSYGYEIYTVDESKTLKDLMAANFSPKEPNWAHKQVNFEEIEKGNYQEKSTLVSDGSIFLVCFVKDGDDVRKTNVIGPILVGSQVSDEKGIETLGMPDAWDLIFFSDSTGWDVAQKYAIHIENDLGVTVNVWDMASGGLSLGHLMERLEQNEFWLDHLAQAEVVVIFANPEDSVSKTNPGNWSCVSREYQVTNCDLETFDQYIEDLSTFYEKVFELRDGQPTIIRAFNTYVPIYSVWKKEGIFDECRQCFLNFTKAIEIAAAKYNVPVGPTFEVFNGVDYDEDPRDKGYIGSDGLHTTDDGSQVMADTLRLLGYEITQPPE